MRPFPLSLLALALLGCPKTPEVATPPVPVPVPEGRPAVSAPDGRANFNRQAARLGVPVFELDTGDLVWLWNGGEPQDPEALAQTVASTTLEATDARQQAVMDELDAGRPTVVLTEVTAEEAPFVKAMLDVAGAIDALHAVQRGSAGLAPADDPMSKALFWRNQGPWCEQSFPEDVPDCRATVQPAPRVVGIYPEAVQKTEGFCAELEAHDPPLMAPFTAVREGEGGLTALPFSEAFPTESEAAAVALETAASALPEAEEALAAYLKRAAASFRDNDWVAADRAWQATREKSAWYVRVGPDETYWDPCDRKGGYHLVFARINPASLKWQQKLEPIKQDMEQAIADKAGRYEARDVAFSLPEFIDIVVNAGDSRSPIGGTTGQSLPNWGPVAEAGGRTVAMTNLNIDPDSLATTRARAASMFCSLEAYTDDPEPLLVSTVLHEAAHNLGPASGYTVDGKTDEEAFGGEVSTMLEELKAQTAALYLTDWLVEREVIDADFARRAHMADLVWILGQISSGMVDAEGGSQAYPQLSAIQLGLLMDAGAVTWSPTKTAANGTDSGCLEVNHTALPAAIERLADQVFAIKGDADVEGATALKEAFVETDPAGLYDIIAVRWDRGPSTSFVYGFRFDDAD